MTNLLERGHLVSIRNVMAEDLAQIAPHAYSVSITEPLTDQEDLARQFQQTNLWQEDAGAVAVVKADGGRLLGTCQFYPSGPCIHGIEIGYIIHAESDRGLGYASEALQLFSRHLFAQREKVHRHQLIIETSNLASCKIAERGEFIREGVLRACGFDAEHPEDCFVYSKTRWQDLRDQEV